MARGNVRVSAAQCPLLFDEPKLHPLDVCPFCHPHRFGTATDQLSCTVERYRSSRRPLGVVFNPRKWDQ
jgi:hypothetical protein